ncbi:endoplasmic oxidoreductin-1, partial [Coemansia sp. RSA 2599]
MAKKRSTAASRRDPQHAQTAAIQKTDVGQTDHTAAPKKTRWFWMAVRVAALVAAAATAYIARDTPSALGLGPQPQAAKQPSPNVGFMAHVLQKSKGQNICKPEGFVMDTYSDFDGIEALNHKVSGPLKKLIRTKFFRTLRVELYKPCQFWTSEGSCFQRDCIVQPLDEQKVPSVWQAQKIDHTSFGPFS